METNPNLDLDGEGGAGAGASSGRSLLPKGSGRFRRSSARCSLPKGSDRFRRSLSPVNSRSLLEGRDVRDAVFPNKLFDKAFGQPLPAPLVGDGKMQMDVEGAPLVGDGKMHMVVESTPLVGDGKMHMVVEEEMTTALAVHQPSSQRSQRIIVIEMMADVGSPSSPGSPYSPSSPSSHRDAPSVRFSSRGIRNHKMPQCDIDRSDTEEDLYSSCEEDPYFNSLVDDFIGAVTSTDLLASSPEIDYMAANQSQSLFYAESALKHYNNNDENKIKYELISAITSNAIIDRSGYGHVNFVAKGDLPDSVDEFFFAEVRWDIDSYVPVCMVSLEGKEKSGGYRDIEVDYPRGGFVGVPVDKNHCYACGDGLKHPEDGTLYESGHIASGSYYD
ncbi:uncharacterized protein [Oryza sativa Japonica Group]|uniref:uncharacterized protein isoform X3 n=1 Tax=Oryza sativa subsp. japonica TaxID=39947 RepID=UPI00001B16E9|nr:uncharacterized protein LOC4336739 isoform X3 [Oryza sativa Japonica Group]KAF2935468.1 hypothetical protein DAI22_04g233500 [Oryza sativa Japonica Group]